MGPGASSRDLSGVSSGQSDIQTWSSRENSAEVRIWGSGALTAVRAMGLDNGKGAGRTTEGRREPKIQPSNILCVDGAGEASEVIWQRCQGTGGKGLASAKPREQCLRLGTATVKHAAPCSTRPGRKMTPGSGSMEAFDDFTRTVSVQW